MKMKEIIYVNKNYKTLTNNFPPAARPDSFILEINNPHISHFYLFSVEARPGISS